MHNNAVIHLPLLLPQLNDGFNFNCSLIVKELLIVYSRVP